MNMMKTTTVRRIIALSMLVILLVPGISPAASRKSKQKVKPVYNARTIPQDPFLPAYTNPQEVDIVKDTLHISLKGLFRGVDEFGRPDDWVYFAFTAKPQNDMYFAVSQSELYDSLAKEYKYCTVPNIGGIRAFGRELIAGVSVPVLVGVNMPIAEAGEYPSVSRISISFNGETLQFRNVVAEDWGAWEELKETLGI